MKKNKNKGFTLIELLVAIALVAMLAGLAITTVSSIGQTRTRKTAETLKSSIEATRAYAKSHSGNTYVSVVKNKDGLQIIEVSTAERAADGTRQDKIISDVQINDKALTVYYKLTGIHDVWQLGVNDDSSVRNSMLQFTFLGSTGEFSGPNYIDYIRLTNGSKEYKLVFEQKTGMIYYDYEDGAANVVNEAPVANPNGVILPKFVVNGVKTKDVVEVRYTGSVVQPELAYDSRNVKMSGVFRAKDPGEYRIIFSLKDPYKTTWEDGTKSDYMLTWVIDTD